MTLSRTLTVFAALSLCVVYSHDAVSQSDPWRRVLPPPLPHDAGAFPATSAPLNVHVLSMPAFGHFQTTKDIAVALANRGHNVTFVLCERNRGDYVKAGLEKRGIHFLSAGACATYDEREPVMAKLVQSGDLGTQIKMLESVAQLSLEMCESVLPYYNQLYGYGNGSDASGAGEGPAEGAVCASSEVEHVRHMRPAGGPDVIVFDADTYCAMDLSIRYRVPRVARVGTGVRSFTDNDYWPIYGSGMRLPDPARSLWGYIKHHFLWALSYKLIAPKVQPNVYARHRQQVVSEQPGGQTLQPDRRWWNPLSYWSPALPVALANGPAYDVVVDEGSWSVDVPWDGVPTLYNTHWGLEHARSLKPYEHVIGHTNDFLAAAEEPLSDPLREWMQATDVPVVYVGLGTLSVVPPQLVRALARAFSSSGDFRFVWSLPAAQQELLPPSLVAASARQVQLLAARAAIGAQQQLLQAKAEDREGSSVSSVTVAADGSTDAAEPITSAEDDVVAAPGSVLLVEWAPQVSVLLHNRTSIFLTHGGMNSMAEGTYARTPLLCMPFFSDQPDNCMHADEHGMGLLLSWQDVADAEKPEEVVEPLLTRLLTTRAYKRNMQAAWVENVAAGGVFRAVPVIEAAGYQPYGAHLRLLPAADRPAAGISVTSTFLRVMLCVIAVALVGGAALCAMMFCCCCAPQHVSRSGQDRFVGLMSTLFMPLVCLGPVTVHPADGPYTVAFCIVLLLVLSLALYSGLIEWTCKCRDALADAGETRWNTCGYCCGMRGWLDAHDKGGRCWCYAPPCCKCRRKPAKRVVPTGA